MVGRSFGIVTGRCRLTAMRSCANCGMQVSWSEADCRGLMAKVQGELCVMAEMVMLYDDKVLP